MSSIEDTLQILERARTFAIERHGDQKYGNNLPYEWHLEKVATLAERLGYPVEIQAAAWLHDVVEDTDTPLDELRMLFGDTIAVIVESVTYTDKDKASNIDKIQKAKQNKGAHVVKFCDSSINFSASALNGAPGAMSQWEATTERYGKFVSELLIDLPKPQAIKDWLLTS